MASFPLPLLTFLLAALAGVLVWRQDLGEPWARRFFAAFFAAIALGSFLVGLRFGYGVERFIPLQRALPLFFGPLVHLGFASLSLPRSEIAQRAAWHLGLAAILAVILPLVFLGWAGSDWIIGLSYLTYAALILRQWRRGEEGLTRAPIGLVRRIRLAMLAAAVVLLLTLLGDSAIAISFALDRRDEAVTMISIGAVLMIAILVGLIVFVGGGAVSQPAARPAPARPEEDLGRVAEDAATLLATSQLYLDSDLSVDRLARRLQVPTRVLSAAINQQEGQNVSQYVNGFRLRHAAELLATTDQSVAAILEASGFLTRSNFYREFQRVYGQSPAAYRQESEARKA